MPFIIDDIIRVPERKDYKITFDIKNKINYWKLFEQTYKDENQKINIDTSKEAVSVKNLLFR